MHTVHVFFVVISISFFRWHYSTLLQVNANVLSSSAVLNSDQPILAVVLNNTENMPELVCLCRL